MTTIEEYLDKYGSLYPKDILTFIKTYYDSPYTYDVLMQIRSKLGSLREDEDLYKGFMAILEKYGMLDGKILEVGCGMYPTLAEHISKKNPNITAIDPALITESIRGLKLIKDYFPERVNVGEFDKIIALQPCEVTVPILSEAISHRKDFSIMLCGCIPDKLKRYFRNDYYRWEDYIRSIITSSMEEDATLYEDKLPMSYNLPFKIFTKVHKKRI